MEQLDYNLLFRRFVGLNADDPVWSATTFSKNGDRLLAGDVAVSFFHGVVEQARRRHLLSSDPSPWTAL
jgi:transposase